MTLMRWRPRYQLSPFRALRDLESEFARLFGDWGGWPERLHPAGLLENEWAPRVDVYQTDNNIVVKADAPGLTKGDFDISVTDNHLTIRGERKKETEVKEEDYHRVERLYGTFERTFHLPPTADTTKIDAAYRDGVLVVTIPNKPEAKPKQIEVEVK